MLHASSFWQTNALRCASRLNLVVVCSVIALFSGCHQQTPEQPKGDGAPQPVTVSALRPERKTLKRIVEQPAQIEGLEETPLIARIPGYVDHVHADIGMRFKGPELDAKGNVVKPGAILAKLSVPELFEEHEQKKALVTQAEAEVAQAEASAKAAEAHVETTAARVTETIAGKARVDASFDRWNAEYVRLDALAAKKIVDEQSRDEALNQRQAAEAARQELDAKVLSAEAVHKESKALRDKAKADVNAAKARVQVTKAKEAELLALVQYADIRAPYDCIVIRRNVHTGHFLQPGTGSGSQPLFVVARTDVLRVVVEIPETDAVLVTPGLKGNIRVQSIKDRDFEGKVARLSGSVDAKSRTLRAEIDLQNKEDLLRPGMYAYVTFHVTLPDRLTLPASAVVTQGEKTFCWQIANGKAVRTPLKVGVRDGGLVEVLKKQGPPAQQGGTPTWVDMTTDEAVISSNLANLTEGQAVVAK